MIVYDNLWTRCYKSIQYLLFTPKCVSCSKVEIFTHSWTRYTVSKTPQKHEDERNYCISFRQKYFQHWSINVWSLNEIWPKRKVDHWSRKILGWRQDFLRWEQLWPFAPILKPSRMSWNSTIIIIVIIVLIMITMIVIIIDQSLGEGAK